MSGDSRGRQTLRPIVAALVVLAIVTGVAVNTTNVGRVQTVVMFVSVSAQFCPTTSIPLVAVSVDRYAVVNYAHVANYLTATPAGLASFLGEGEARGDRGEPDEDWRDSKFNRDVYENRVGMIRDAADAVGKPAEAAIAYWDRWWNGGGWKEYESELHLRLKVSEACAAGGITGFEDTELGLADRFVSMWGSDIAYYNERAKWLVWNGSIWRIDESGRVFRMMRSTVDSLLGEIQSGTDDDTKKRRVRLWQSSSTSAKVGAALEAASNTEGIRVGAEALDRDPYLLPCANGTVDLRMCELRESRREDRATLACPVSFDPDAASPVWDSFLRRVQPDVRMRSYLQRAIGYTLTSDTTEQVFFMNHGGGNNGKTTFFRALAMALGPFSLTAHASTFRQVRDDKIPNDLARMRGARMVAVNETEDRWILNEGLIKQVAGGDVIPARFLNHEWFEYTPTFKLWLWGNQRPVITGTEEGIWRKAQLVSWSVHIEDGERDRSYLEKLRPELPGVLRWAVDGCRLWQRFGLRPPASVTAATKEYREDQDVLGSFLSDCTEQKPNAAVVPSELYSAYTAWSVDSGIRPWSAKMLGSKLKNRGIEQARTSVSRLWRGLELSSKGREYRDSGRLPAEEGPSGPRGRPRSRLASRRIEWGDA